MYSLCFRKSGKIFVKSKVLALLFLKQMHVQRQLLGGKSGGVEDAVLHGQTGSVIDPFSPDDCANTLIQYLEAPEFAESQGKAGRLRVETELNWAATTERMISIIESDNFHGSNQASWFRGY